MSNILLHPFSAYDYLSSGISENEIEQVYADRILGRAKKLEYKPTGTDLGSTHAREITRLNIETADGRFIHGIFAAMLRDDLHDLCNYYGVWDQPSTITALRLGPGYHLDWHNHLNSGGAASILLYLFDQGEGVGGEFDQGRVLPDLTSIEITKTIKPKHGTVVVLGDGSHPLNKHRARKWEGEGYRYLISFAYNASDW